ncbi:WD40 repeat domain-containing protein [Streptomyces sp. NPDC051211]|uniref:WD40 repeat domain-containing protein n=1 Tax=Streptomyces sp. NPDC051211 TaxID=3154643 RepID=UPI00344DB88D
MKYSPDGHTLATDSGDGTVVLWDVAAGTPRSTLKQGPAVLSVAFTPDGRTLATGGLDQFARVWDVAAGKVVSTLDTHAEKVVSVAFSPDGRTLGTGGFDKTMRLWNVVLPQPAAAVKRICQAVNHDLTREERMAYQPGQSVGTVCPRPTS